MNAAAAGLPAEVVVPTADRLLAAFDADGYVRVPRLLSAAQCAALAGVFEEAAAFRSHVHMARHNFGRGEYKYFATPLPPLVAGLRAAFYPALAAVANDWQVRLGLAPSYPARLADYLARCHAAGQRRPTPLLLRYRAGDYNCLHQDRYGEEVFPLQLTVLLSVPGRDFDGGEFVLTEQRPRLQSRVAVVPLAQGDAVVFAVSARPVAGRRGHHRLNTRHGVSRLHRGERYALGVIFHDAQ